jgi:farnesyl diphosphate synthase
MMDMLSGVQTYTQAEIIQLQNLKTGALFEFSAEAGPILAEAGSEDQARLGRFARDMGLAFQIADDLIDATGEAASAGKAVGKDEAQGKATLLSIWGLDGARKESRRLAESAADALSPYGDAAKELQALPFFLLDRVS